MRYYGSTFKDEYLAAIESIKETVENTQFGTNIDNVSLNSDLDYLRSSCANVGYSADSRIVDIKDKFETFKTIVSGLYDDLNEVAADIYSNACEASQALISMKSSLRELNSILNAGTFNGSPITAADVDNAMSGMSNAEQHMQSYWTGYFTNPDGSFDEENVQRYFENTDEMIANGQDNTFETDCLINLVDGYLADNNYSEESYAEMLNMLTGCALVEQDTSAWNLPEQVEVNGEDYSQYTVFYDIRNSYGYLIARANYRMQIEYAITGDANGDIMRRSTLYDCMDAVSSNGAIALTSYVPVEECWSYEDPEALQSYASSLATPSFTIDIRTEDGNRCAEIGYSGSCGGYPNTFYFASISDMGVPELGTEVNSIEVYSCTSDIAALVGVQQGESATDMAESFRTDLGSFFADEIPGWAFGRLAGDLFENTPPGFVIDGLGMGLDGWQAYYDNCRIDQFEHDYSQLESMGNFYSNTNAVGCYWVVNSGDESHVYVSPHYYVTPQNVESYLCFEYYTGRNDTIIEPSSSLANEQLHDTEYASNRPSMSYEDFMVQLNSFWNDYYYSITGENAPCYVTQLSPNEIAELTYACREANESAGTYYSSTGYVPGSYDSTTFENVDIDVSRFEE